MELKEVVKKKYIIEVDFGMITEELIDKAIASAFFGEEGDRNKFMNISVTKYTPQGIKVLSCKEYPPKE